MTRIILTTPPPPHTHLPRKNATLLIGKKKQQQQQQKKNNRSWQYRLVKRLCYLLKLSSGTKICACRADNSVKNWRNLPINNSKPDLLNVIIYVLSRYSLEPPHRGGYNEYPQSVFLSRNKNNIRVFYLKIFRFWRWNFLYIWIGMFSLCLKNKWRKGNTNKVF